MKSALDAWLITCWRPCAEYPDDITISHDSESETMKICLFNAYCPQMGRNVQIALDEEAQDPYRNSFKEVFSIPMEMRFLLGDSRGIQSFLDVGANIGHFSLSAGLMGISTIAVEAMADNYLLLARTLSANGLDNVLPLHLAATDKFSLVALQSYGAWAMISEVGKGDTPGIPLDALIPLTGRRGPDLIKIDVEGHEIPVLMGMERILRSARPLLIFEGNSSTSRDFGGCRRLLQVVDSFDYDLFVFNLDGTVRPINTESPQDVVCVDYFAYPRGIAPLRARPATREATLDERLGRIELDVDAGIPHRWHISTIIEDFAAEVDLLDSGQNQTDAALAEKFNRQSRIDTIRQRLAEYSPK